jgi:hypothetical protein
MLLAKTVRQAVTNILCHPCCCCCCCQSEIELRRYRESLGLPDPTGATGAVIPLNDVIIASTQETLRALLVSVRAAVRCCNKWGIACSCCCWSPACHKAASACGWYAVTYCCMCVIGVCEHQVCQARYVVALAVVWHLHHAECCFLLLLPGLHGLHLHHR